MKNIQVIGRVAAKCRTTNPYSIGHFLLHTHNKMHSSTREVSKLTKCQGGVVPPAATEGTTPEAGDQLTLKKPSLELFSVMISSPAKPIHTSMLIKACFMYEDQMYFCLLHQFQVYQQIYSNLLPNKKQIGVTYGTITGFASKVT